MSRFAGVDCHPDSHTIVLVDDQGRLLIEKTIASEASGFGHALGEEWCRGDIVWGLEGTGTYGRALADYLVSHGFDVYEVPGAVTKRYRKHSTRPGKSDPIDARAIAEAVLKERNRLPRFFGSTDLEALRVMYDHRDRLVRERTQAVNRVRSALMRLQLSKPHDLTSVRQLRSVRATLKAYKRTGPLVGAFVRQAMDATDAIKLYTAQIREAETTLRAFAKPFKQLLAIYGVSFVVAAGIVGHAGDLRNCRSADSFAMRSAVAPVPCSSGRNRQVRVNLGGNRQLNRLLHTVAVTQISHPGTIGRQYYDRKLTEGKTPRSALRSLKRRLATVVYYRLRRDLEAGCSDHLTQLAA